MRGRCALEDQRHESKSSAPSDAAAVRLSVAVGRGLRGCPRVNGRSFVFRFVAEY